MDTENVISNVQTILYKGFDSTINGGLEWLNVIFFDLFFSFRGLTIFYLFSGHLWRIRYIF